MTLSLLAFLTPAELTMLRHPTPHLMPGCACCHDLPATLTALAEARQQLQQAREALRKYGQHLDGCGCHGNCEGVQEHMNCTCGFSDSLAGGTG